MQYRSVFKVLGILIGIVGVTLLIPMFYALFTDFRDFWSFFYSALASILVGGLLALIPKSNRPFKNRDGFALVSFGWLAAGLSGALPFMLGDQAVSFTDAYFESISGFTTTGSSIMTNIEGLSPALLLWRSMTQWFGGMGIVVLTLAIVPYLDIGGMSIFQAEVPGPTAEKLTPRIQDTAKVLWMIYLAMTVVLVVLLWIFGMNWFDSVNHAMTTMSTGGFSTNNASVAGFRNPAVEWIITLFMALAGINFALHYRFLFRRLNPKPYFEDSEVRFYLLVIFLSVMTIVGAIVWQQGWRAMEPLFRDVSFTVVSIITTTGFGTADYELWPIYGQFILILLMIMGGCAGSTAGGIKSVRILLVLKYMYLEIVKLLHPAMIRTVKLGKNVVHREVLNSILGFIFIYTSIMAFSILAVSLETSDVTTAFSAVIACLSNIGPGLGEVGPTDNFAALGDFTKWVLSLNMVMGRLELLTIVILFFPQTWRK